MIMGIMAEKFQKTLPFGTKKALYKSNIFTKDDIDWCLWITQDATDYTSVKNRFWTRQTTTRPLMLGIQQKKEQELNGPCGKRCR